MSHKLIVALLAATAFVSRPWGHPLAAAPESGRDSSPAFFYKVPTFTGPGAAFLADPSDPDGSARDRKSTRLNSSHVKISYAVFCLKKKTRHITEQKETQHDFKRKNHSHPKNMKNPTSTA